MSKATGFSGTQDAFLRQRGDESARGRYVQDEIVSDTQIEEKRLKEQPLLQRWEPIVMPIVFTLLALVVRMYKIGANKNVVWDEAHFGSFGSYYLKHEFYHDVHPPLGKMLVGLSGYIAGYNGTFSFDSGVEYPEWVDFVKMRIFNALFSVGCVPLAYFTGKAIGFSLPATWFFTVCVLFENSFTTLGKLILLDSMLLFFTVASFFCFVKFHNQRNKSFSYNWWKWLSLTGFNLGCAISVKMVGLFIITLVGIYTVIELWNGLGNKQMPWKTYLSHWVARIICLILIPFTIFATSFYVHFALLTHDGNGSSVMPPLFQARLINSTVGTGPRDIAIGSNFTLKNYDIGGTFLHSHANLYPEGSQQQQVTGYGYNDENNKWYFDRIREQPYWTSDETEIEFVNVSHPYRIYHWFTGRNLHSHTVAAPITTESYEVSGYGNATIGDANDYWTVEVVEQKSDEDPSRVHPLTTIFRLKHEILQCYLQHTGNLLPEWGFKQIEMVCTKDARKNDKSTWWTIEDHDNVFLPPRPENFKFPKTNFFKDFFHLNFAMMASNNALVPEYDKFDPIASSAWEWPTLHVGLRICSWADEFPKYFLMGTPLTTWGSSIAVLGFMVFVVLQLLRWQRQYQVLSDPNDLNLFLMGGFYPLLAWGLHYTPFVIMSRVTYVHHYLPALYFALIILTYTVEATLNKIHKNKLRVTTFALLIAATVACFLYFSPISFGMVGPASKYKHLKWLKTWDIYDEPALYN